MVWHKHKWITVDHISFGDRVGYYLMICTQCEKRKAHKQDLCRAALIRSCPERGMQLREFIEKRPSKQHKILRLVKK